MFRAYFPFFCLFVTEHLETAPAAAAAAAAKKKRNFEGLMNGQKTKWNCMSSKTTYFASTPLQTECGYGGEMGGW